MIDTDQLLADLTEPQREAATPIDGPLLIIAGAGSGKTRVLTRRVAYLVAQGIPASSITGRISMVPKRAPGIRAAMPMASSRSLASIRK